MMVMRSFNLLVERALHESMMVMRSFNLLVERALHESMMVMRSFILLVDCLALLGAQIDGGFGAL